ncbi:MAG: alpha/beta hydrolase [Actinomycetota bacterium]
MPVAPSGDVEIFYDTFGSPGAPAIMFISGFGSQMIGRPDDFCRAIADEGFFFVRFDNRDVGMSTQCEDMAQYSLEDMAKDAVAVLDHAGVDAAHVVGMSMGGMIAQLVALNHPERVLTLTSVMSAMGEPDAVPATPEAQAIFLQPLAATREEFIERAVIDRRVIGSTGFDIGEGEVREIAALSWDRGHYPAGRIRQALAIRASAPRKAALSKLTIPVTVMHGTADPLIPVENGVRTADAIPGAELVLIEGMGHDLPRGAWGQVIGGIVATARRAATATA